MKIQTYGSKVRLMNNQRYTAALTVGGRTHEITFTSRYSPLYSSAKILRNDFDELFAKLTDEQLNFAIWQASILIDELMVLAESTPEDGVTYAMKQYTRYKAEYMLVRRILVARGARAGAQEKSLGEFKVAEEVKTPDIEAILRELANDAKIWESTLDLDARPASGVRALRTEYPLNGRVSF